MKDCCASHGLTTPKIPTKVTAMDTFIVSENLFTGRSSFLENNSLSSPSNKDSGVGLVQFNAATKPEFKKKVMKQPK